MVLKLPSSALKAIPITVKEFGESLTSIWNHHTLERRPITLGLAISGGVDSMALASLCARAQSSGLYDWRFLAFVVDHGVRPGSGEEAKSVANILKEKGIDTKVLQIEWPEDPEPLQSTKFEYLARIYRYRILGDACRDSDLRNILLAHHDDDQYETIMMRLARGHRGFGLVGMKPYSQIPECYGRYGVHDSGAASETFHETQHAKRARSKSPWESLNFGRSAQILQKPTSNTRIGDGFLIPEPTQTDTNTTIRPRGIRPVPYLRQMPLEDGGISVLRPLLQYSKERLIATCLEDSTPWFEDYTNADPTLTERNAIRHIYRKHSLPVALQKDAIIALAAGLRRKQDLLNREALKLLDHCFIRNFEPRVGTVVVRFPKFAFLETSSEEESNGIARHNQRELASLLLKYAIDIVKPNEHVRVTTLGQARSTVFPELRKAQESELGSLKKFTVAGVLFQREKPQVSHLVEGETPEVRLDDEQKWQKDEMPMQDDEWFLSRQPHDSQIRRQPTLEFPPLSFCNGKTDGWKFYDGRYWIRVFNHTMTPIKVRHLQKEDLKTFTTALKPKTRRTFEHRLKTMAPGDIRFTLPAIMLVGAGPGGEDWVLAVPTLDIALPGVNKFMHYEIKYKKVEWPRHIIESQKLGMNGSQEVDTNEN